MTKKEQFLTFVFMGALATGYYLGGSLADKHPYFEWLAGIVGAALFAASHAPTTEQRA